MKVKRLIAWLLVCVLQGCVCLLIPMYSTSHEAKIDQNGESYRIALRSVQPHPGERHALDLTVPPTLYDPETAEETDTLIRVVEVGSDGLARVRERGATWEEAAQHLTPPIYDLYNQPAAWFVSARVQKELGTLTQIMDALQSCGADEVALAAEKDRLDALAEEIGEPALRDLAHRQIDTKNGDALFDSYVTAVIYETDIVWEEVYVAGLHVATIQS